MTKREEAKHQKECDRAFKFLQEALVLDGEGVLEFLEAINKLIGIREKLGLELAS